MNETYSIVYSPKAKEDLEGIYSYIAFELLVPDTARGQTDRIRNAIRTLDFMPFRNPAVDWEPWKSIGMRKIPVDNFAVFYLADESRFTVTVIRIVYEGRNRENLAAAERNSEKEGG